MRKFLVVRPDYEDATHAGAVFLKLLITDRLKGREDWECIDVYGNEATRANVRSILEGTDINSFVMVGHGNYTSTTVQNQEVLWDVNDVPDVHVKGRKIFTLSCQCGRDLGKVIAGKGAEVYKGYSESFVFAWNKAVEPDKDEYATSTLTPAVLRACWFDKTPDEAELEGEAEAKKWVDYWKKKGDYELAYIISYDERIKVYYRNGAIVPPNSPPSCFVSRLLATVLGRKALLALRRLRKKLFNVAPGYP